VDRATPVNSASFGFNFPAPAGEKPLLDPNGQIIGPVRFWDIPRRSFADAHRSRELAARASRRAPA
jgi:hypothetical protein